MEFVEGVPITRWVRDHALDARATVTLLLKLCRAVQFAHANLVVHSDIKPSNVLVGADGTPRLLDFGIAKVLGDEPGVASTRTAMRMLTPEYAAPELLDGAAVTTSVDVHALGVLAWEMLTGSRPPRDGAQAGSGQASLRGDLGRIVGTATAADPTARYPSVEAFAGDLRAWRDGLPVSVRADSAWYRMRKFVQRHRVGVAATLAVALTLSAATAYSAWQARIANRQMQRAQAVRDFLAGAFAAIDPARNEGRKLGLAQMVRQSERRLLADHDMPAAVRADLMGMIGTFYWDLADTPRAERSLEAAVAMGAQADIPASVRARTLATLARVEQDRNDFRDGWRHAADAHHLAMRAATPDVTLVADTRRLAAALLVPNVGPRRAEPALRALLADDRASFGNPSQVLIDDLILLGQAFDGMGRYARAQSSLEEAANMARRLGSPGTSSLGLSLDLLGITLLHRGDFDGAGRAFKGSREVTSRLWGAGNVRSSIVREQQLELAVRQGHAREALPGVRVALAEAAHMRAGRPDHYASAWTLLGDVHLGLGEPMRAATAYRHALVAWSRVPQGVDSDGMARSLTGLATALRVQGRLEAAERASRIAVAITERNPGAGPAALARDRATLAEVLLARGDHRAARGVADAAVAAARRTLPAGNWQRAPALLALGRVELADGQAIPAAAALDEAARLWQRLLPPADPRRRELDAALAAVQGMTAGR